MKIRSSWKVIFYPYDTAQGRRIAGPLEAVFLFEPGPQDVLEVMHHPGNPLTQEMQDRILAKDYGMIRQHPVYEK